MRTQEEYDQIIAEFEKKDICDLKPLSEEDRLNVQIMQLELALKSAKKELKQIKNTTE
jgi:hypothetical protein